MGHAFFGCAAATISYGVHTMLMSEGVHTGDSFPTMSKRTVPGLSVLIIPIILRKFGKF